MVSPIFKNASRVIFRTFREAQPAMWMRLGQPEADAIDCHFNAAWQEIDANGVAITDPIPKATFQLSDVLAIDPTRDGRASPVFLNNDRDTLTVNGRVYGVESFKLDGYDWVEVFLIGLNDA